MITISSQVLANIFRMTHISVVEFTEPYEKKKKFFQNKNLKKFERKTQ